MSECSSSTSTICPKTLKNGRYHLGEALGKGGYGTVYRVTDVYLKIPVAIKTPNMNEKPEENEQTVANFRKEGRLLAGLRDPRNSHIPRFYDRFQENGNWYLAMEYIEGETLADYIKKQSGGRLPVKKAFDIIMQLCDVLHYLHTRPQPIVFRDLTPNNIMLTPKGHIYLVDFGIALLFKKSIPDPQMIGTSGYVPPEQYKRRSCPASDIYALGAILHQMLTGKRPVKEDSFQFKPLTGNVPELDGQPILQELDTLIRKKMVNPEPTKRYSAEEVKQKLISIYQKAKAKAVAAAPISSKVGQGAVQKPVAPARRKKRSNVFVKVLAIVLLSLWLGPGGLGHSILLKVKGQQYVATIASVDQHDATRWSLFSGSYTTTTYDVEAQWFDETGVAHSGIFQTDNSGASTIVNGDSIRLDCLPQTSDCILDL